jgi:ParB/RepB/Spo0J family partition protein
MTNKARLEYIDPAKLEIPEVRITSVFDGDVHEMFAEDIKKQGIDQALLIAKDGEHYIVVDGKNRREEAMLKGIKKVPCLVRDMTMVDALLRNLVLNRLRGKTKASEEVLVIKELEKKHGYGIEKIVEKTGYTRDRVEMLMQIGGVTHEVWESLDEGKIPICAAFEISRLPDRSSQLRSLRIVEQFGHMSCKELKGHIDDVIEIMTSQKEEAGVNPVPPPSIPAIECNICHGSFSVKDMTSLMICRNCYSVAVLGWEEAKKEYEQEKEKKAKIAAEIAGGGASEG